VQISKKAMLESESQMLVLEAVDFGATPGCGDGSPHFTPMGMPWLTVRATGATALAEADLSWSAVMSSGGWTLPFSESDCGDGNPATFCATFHSSVCQPMVISADNTCSFANKDIAFPVSVTSAFGATNKTFLTSLLFSGKMFSPCDRPETTLNVTANYKIGFNALGEDDSPAISLTTPVVARLSLLNASSVSIYITEVTVELIAPASTTGLAAVTLAFHTFTREEKLSLMREEISPYYADAHFCRTPSGATCSSFYGIDGNENDLTKAAADIYRASATGGYKSCQGLSALNEDRFIFTPR
jgi:hypothetical protein